MSAEQIIIEAINLFNNGEIAPNKCRKICIKLGSLLRNDELGKTQIPVVLYIFGRCNVYLGNKWGAARAFKKVMSSNASKKQMEYAEAFVVSLVDEMRKKIDLNAIEISRLSKKVIKMQITD